MTVAGSVERRLLPAVLALGVTQVIGYGTLYYSFAVLAPAVADTFAIPTSQLFAIFSVGLLVGGLISPAMGKMMDAHGAPRLMAIGSVLAAVGLMAAALAPGIVAFGVVTVALEVASVLVLYDAAFATLARLGGVGAQRSVTHLTLIAGFASTVFWPLCGWLLDGFGWRGVYGVFAGLHLCVALPLHLWLWRRPAIPAGYAGRNPVAADRHRPLASQDRTFAFWCVAASFALSGFLVSALGVHLIPILQSIGLGTAAYAASMLMGPAQVAIRLTDAIFWGALHPLAVALICAVALPAAVLMLLVVSPAVLAGGLFALLFGIGQGLTSIVRGTVPLALFGPDGFGARLGRLAAIRIVLGAGAPFLFAAIQETAGLSAALALMLVLGLLATLPLALLRLRMRRRRRFRPAATAG